MFGWILIHGVRVHSVYSTYTQPIYRYMQWDHKRYIDCLNNMMVCSTTLLPWCNRHSIIPKSTSSNLHHIFAWNIYASQSVSLTTQQGFWISFINWVSMEKWAEFENHPKQPTYLTHRIQSCINVVNTSKKFW